MLFPICICFCTGVLFTILGVTCKICSWCRPIHPIFSHSRSKHSLDFKIKPPVSCFICNTDQGVLFLVIHLFCFPHYPTLGFKKLSSVYNINIPKLRRFAMKLFNFNLHYSYNIKDKYAIIINAPFPTHYLASDVPYCSRGMDIHQVHDATKYLQQVYDPSSSEQI